MDARYEIQISQQRSHLRKSIPLVFWALAPLATAGDWRELFDGKSLDGWDVLVANGEVGVDQDQFVQVRDGTVHMYADTDPEEHVKFGIAFTKEEFSRFRLTGEYRWLGKRFAPRKEELRDAGILFHMESPTKIWPRSVEYQIQEGDTGDLVMLQTEGFSWLSPTPDQSPEGQGQPAMLPEHGGVPIITNRGFAYLGRLPELDRAEGWNEVDLVVHGRERAVFRVNGEIIARVDDMRTEQGEALDSGHLAIQFEGAEIQYRNLKIKELDEPLRADSAVVALSAVKSVASSASEISITNPHDTKRGSAVQVFGADAGAFSVEASAAELDADGEMTVTVRFDPDEGARRYAAGLRIGDEEEGAFVLLQGISLEKFEGGNEPALKTITDAFGIPVDVGGSQLALGVKPERLGTSLVAKEFAALPDESVRITPLARFSPPGDVPFGIRMRGDQAREIGVLADVSEEIPDAHQRLMPPLVGGAAVVLLENIETPFSIYLKGPHFTSSTDSDQAEGAKVPNTARIWPVTHFLGRSVANTYLLGFEEAENGDYQDALFLIENVTTVRE